MYKSLAMAILFVAFGLLMVPASATRAADYVIFCAPGLAKGDKESVWLEFQKFVAGGGGKINDPKRGMKPGDTLQLFNASTLRQIGPELLMPDSARTPALQLKAASDVSDAFKRFLSDETLQAAPANIPGLVATYKEKVNAKEAKVLVIGSPLYFDDVEAHDMRQGWLSDGYFAQPSEVTVFGVAGKDASLRGNTIRFCTLLDDGEYGTENKRAHQDMIKRFWALYLAQCGGKLVSFQQDIVTAFQTLAKDDLEEKIYSLNPNDQEMVVHKSKIELRSSMDISESSSLERTSANTRTQFSSDSDLAWLFADDVDGYNKGSGERPSTPGRPWVTRIGLVWPTEGDYADQDLDLYVRPRSATEELSFKTVQTDAGRYIKDFPAQSSAKYGFEIVDLTAEESPSDLQIWVNAYSGNPKSGFRGEVRVLHKGLLKVYPVDIAATSGNKGTDAHNRNRSKFWAVVDAQ